MNKVELARYDKRRRKKALQHGLSQADILRDQHERHHLGTGTTQQAEVVKHMVHAPQFLERQQHHTRFTYLDAVPADATTQLVARAQAAHTQEHVDLLQRLEQERQSLAKEGAGLDAAWKHVATRQRAEDAVAKLDRVDAEVTRDLAQRVSRARELVREEAGALRAAMGLHTKLSPSHVAHLERSSDGFGAPAATSSSRSSSALDPSQPPTSFVTSATSKPSTASSYVGSAATQTTASASRSSASTPQDRSARTVAKLPTKGRPVGLSRRRYQIADTTSASILSLPPFPAAAGLQAADAPYKWHDAAAERRYTRDLVTKLQARQANDEDALAILRIRQHLLQQQLDTAARRLKTPKRQVTEYSEAMQPVAALCAEIVDEIIDRAMHRTLFRPQLAHVIQERMMWAQASLEERGVAAQLLLEHVVGGAVQALLGEVVAEVLDELEAPKRYAMDMLVSSIVGVCRAGLEDANVQAMITKTEIARVTDMYANDGNDSSDSDGPPDGASMISSTASSRSRTSLAQIAQQQRNAALLLIATSEADEDEAASDSRRSSTLGGSSRQLIAHGSGVGSLAADRRRTNESFASSARSNRSARRAAATLAKALGKDVHATYVEAVKAVLVEMTRMRDHQTFDAYAHSQPLQFVMPDKARMSSALKARLLSLRSPLAAVSGWRYGAREPRRVALGAPASAQHIAVSAVEALYWEHCVVSCVSSSRKLTKAEGTITDLAVHNSGFCTAIATSTGAVMVFEVRDGSLRETHQLAGTSSGAAERAQQQRQRRLRRGSAGPSEQVDVSEGEVCGLDLSLGNRLAVLHSEGGSAVFSMRPHDSSKDSVDGPLELAAIAHLKPDEMVGSGKQASRDPVLLVAPTTSALKSKLQDARAERAHDEHVVVKRRPAFHASFTVLGSQPNVLLPLPCGDVLRYSLPDAGPLLLGGMREKGQAHALPPPVSVRATAYMLPAAATESTTVPAAAQRIYRHHDTHVVLITFLADSGVMLTVDMSGDVALWPATDNKCSGFGWFEPTRVFHTDDVMVALQVSGDLNSHAGEEGSPIEKGYVPWLTLYERSANGIQRMVYYTPGIGAQGGSVRPQQQDISHDVHAVLVETYAAGGELAATHFQGARRARVPTRIVDACLTQTRDFLVLVSPVPDPNPSASSTGQPYFRFQAVSLTTWQVELPMIDVVDWSFGTSAPVYCLMPQVRALGSEFLMASIGLNVIGVYSLTSGCLVSELVLPIGPTAGPTWGPSRDEPGTVLVCRLAALRLFTLTDRFGPARLGQADGDAENDNGLAWSQLLAVAMVQPDCSVKLLHFDDEVALERVVADRAITEANRVAALEAAQRREEEAEALRAEQERLASLARLEQVTPLSAADSDSVERSSIDSASDSDSEGTSTKGKETDSGANASSEPAPSTSKSGTEPSASSGVRTSTAEGTSARAASLETVTSDSDSAGASDTDLEKGSDHALEASIEEQGAAPGRSSDALESGSESEASKDPPSSSGASSSAASDESGAADSHSSGSMLRDRPAHAQHEAANDANDATDHDGDDSETENSDGSRDGTEEVVDAGGASQNDDDGGDEVTGTGGNTRSDVAPSQSKLPFRKSAGSNALSAIVRTTRRSGFPISLGAYYPKSSYK